MRAPSFIANTTWFTSTHPQALHIILFSYLYKYIFCDVAYFSIYKITYTMFSWLNPIMLNRSTGRQNTIIKNIFIINLIFIKLIIQKIKIHQNTLSNAVE